MRLLILNGFDRSGSSMMGGVLAKHPETAFMFQPFSSTEVHRDQFTIWRAEDNYPTTENFLHGCLKGNINEEYIEAIWHGLYGNVADIKNKKLNVVKETKMHFKIEWLQAKFPEILFYGIWRDPRGMLASLVSNNFHKEWYEKKDTFNTVSTLVRQEKEFDLFLEFLNADLNSVQRMAFIIAVAVRYQMNRLQKDEWIVYEDILENPNRVFNGLLKKIGNFKDFDFIPFMKVDYNPSGNEGIDPFQWKSFFSASELEKISPIFNLIDWKNYE